MSYSSALERFSKEGSCAKFSRTLTPTLSKLQKAMTNVTTLNIPPVVSQRRVVLRTSLFSSEWHGFLSWPTGQHWPDHPWLGGEGSVSLHPGQTLLLLHHHRPRLCCREPGSSHGRPASEMCLNQAERRVCWEKTFTWSCWSANLQLPSVADVITRISCYSAFISIQNWIINQYLLHEYLLYWYLFKSDVFRINRTARATIFLSTFSVVLQWHHPTFEFILPARFLLSHLVM